MASYTLRIRRFSPESGQAARWEDFGVELEGHQSILDAILQVRDRHDGSLAIRCSCQAAICGSCGVRVNGKPHLACHVHLDAAAEGAVDGVITVEPMGNMPVVKDLIVDMEAVHWKKIRRVTPWLVNAEPVPEREYVVPPESMIDVTQSMACIQCGCCVSDCLSMEVDPLFIGPAALAKAYRFVGDPRDGAHDDRLRDLADDPHGMYDCTHCFNCIEACPKGVAPMSQIMRLRRIATADFGIVDSNNGYRHEHAFVSNIERNGILHEGDLLPDSYGGKFHPRAVPVLLGSLPAIVKALQRRKVTLGKALGHPHKAPDDVKRIFKVIHARPERDELNLYVSGVEDDPGSLGEAAAGGATGTHGSSGGGQLPAERSPNL